MPKRRDSAPASSTLEEIESIFDRAANWVSTNPVLFLTTVVGLLLVGAIIGVGDWYLGRQAKDAADAVSRLQVAYFTALGAGPEEFQEAEPVNPSMKGPVREEYLAAFLTMAEKHAGSIAALQALAEAGSILAAQGKTDAAIETWEKAKATGKGRGALRGLLSLRIGANLEKLSRWAEAGLAYEEAANAPDFPSRQYALIDAARCYARAGNAEKAATLAAQFQEETSGREMPAHLRALAANLSPEQS